MARIADIARRVARAALGETRRRPAATPRPPAGDPRVGEAPNGPTIVYLPDPDGDPDPGEVVWAWVPFEDDPAQGKDRPVLVIGTDGPLLLAVPMSSKDHAHRRDRDEWVDVGTGGWDRDGRPSEADAGRLLRYDPREVRREGATLGRGRFDAVVARARQLHPELGG